MCNPLKIKTIIIIIIIMRISEAGFEQLANVISFHVADTIFPRKKMFFLPQGDDVRNMTYGEKQR